MWFIRYLWILCGLLSPSITFLVQCTEIPFCSGRSQVVALSSANRLVLDGSNSQLVNYIPVAAQSGTTCKCSITPTALVQTMTVTMRSSRNVEYCGKNLRVVLPNDYYYDTVSCVGQAYTLESVGSRTLDITLGLVNVTSVFSDFDETYQVSVEGTTKTAETEFRVTCYSPTSGVSSTSKKPTTSSTLNVTSSTMSTTSTTIVGSITTTRSDQTDTGESKTVLIVCLIVACGLLLMSVTICVLCCIARRVEEKEVEKHQRSPRRIYRRICNTIRTLPSSLNLRRPLPAPPESSVKVTKIRTRVSKVDSGPYDSIKSSVKSVESTLNSTAIAHVDSQNEYGYIYPIYNKDKREKKISPLAIEDPDKYLTPIQNRPTTNNGNTEDTCSLDSDYVNAALSVGTEEVSTDNVDGQTKSTGQYMEMWNARNGQKEVTAVSNTNTSTEIENNSESPTSCKQNVLPRQPTQDTYMEMDNASTDENRTVERDQMTSKTLGNIINSENVQNIGIMGDGTDSVQLLKRQSTQDTYIDMDNSVSNDLCENYEGSPIPSTKDFKENSETENTNSKAVLTREPTQDVYMDMDHTCENRPDNKISLENNRKVIENGKHDIHNDYMAMGEKDCERNEERKESIKDKTFPNLMKFHVASIKPKLRFSKKKPPPIKPKPVKYVPEMPVEK